MRMLGLIGLVVSLLIVAWLAKTSLSASTSVNASRAAAGASSTSGPSADSNANTAEQSRQLQQQVMRDIEASQKQAQEDRQKALGESE